MYLNEQEKELQKESLHLLQSLKNKVDEFLEKAGNFELFNEEHFSELRHHFDIRREKLKVEICQQIDDYACNLIERTKAYQKSFNQSQKEIKIENFDFEKQKKTDQR